MGAVKVKTLNDRLLRVDYKDPETIKQLISNWSMLEGMAQRGDTVASAILVDLQRVIGVNISELENGGKSVGIKLSENNNGVLTQVQFISLVYVLIMGYKYEEVAFILGCTRQGVDRNISGALRKICKTLTGGRHGKEDKKKRRRSGG